MKVSEATAALVLIEVAGLGLDASTPCGRRAAAPAAPCAPCVAAFGRCCLLYLELLKSRFCIFETAATRRSCWGPRTPPSHARPSRGAAAVPGEGTTWRAGRNGRGLGKMKRAGDCLAEEISSNGLCL